MKNVTYRLTYQSRLVFGHANVNEELLGTGVPSHDVLVRQPIDPSVFMVFGPYRIKNLRMLPSHPPIHILMGKLILPPCAGNKSMHGR